MKNTYLLFFLILGYGFTNAQTNLDSLYSVWKDKTQVDSDRVYAFRKYIWKGFLYSQPDSAMVLVEQLEAFTTERSDKQGLAHALNLKGEINHILGKNQIALNYHQRSLKIREEIGARKSVSVSLNNIGVLYHGLGDDIKALDYYMKSLKIKEEIGNKNSTSATLNNIGVIYLLRDDYQKSLEYFLKSLKIRQEQGNKQGIAECFVNIGLIYYKQEEFPEALDYLKRGLIVFEEIQHKRGMANALNNIGQLYFDKKNYHNALEYHKQSKVIAEEIDFKIGICSSFNNIGLAHYELNNITLAIEYCKKGLIIAETTGSISKQIESCECLYNAHKTLDSQKKALAYHEQMLLLTDNFQAEETAKKLQQMEFSKQVLADSLFQVEKDLKVEMANQAEGRKKDKNRNIAIGVGLFFLLLSAGFFTRWRYVKKSKAIIEKEKDRSDNLLLNILPAEIAEELKTSGKADARDFDLVSILFTDFKNFTETSEKLTAKELIGEINHCFEAFDHICEKFGIEKIKTIGDAYMAGGGLPVPSNDSVKNTVLAALSMQSFISERIIEKRAKHEIPFEMRLGIHTGPVVAGIVGVKKFQYDIWGDTVNTASRMESNGEISKVNISEDTYNWIKDDPIFIFESRGKIEAKGKGKMDMYFVTKAL